MVGEFVKGGSKLGAKFFFQDVSQRTMKRRLVKQGLLDAADNAHDWLIPQRTWGNVVPRGIKNAGWNIKGLDWLTHVRVHGNKVGGRELGLGPRIHSLPFIRC